MHASEVHPQRDHARSAWRALLATATAAAALITPAGLATASPRAHAAHVLRATAKAQLRYNAERSEGSRLYEEGSATGTLGGAMHVDVNTGATFTATFTLYVHGGTIVGHAWAKPHGAGRYESFAGTLYAQGGSGRYVHARGTTGFYGVLDRRTYNMIVQTTGTLTY